MAISARDRLRMMASQTYDSGAIRAAPDLRLGDTDPSVVEVQNYLIRYGYLSPTTATVPGAVPGAVSGQLDAATVRALEEFQRRFNVGTPGVLDSPTRELMATPRCGLPDLVGPVTFNTLCAWNRRNLTYAFGTLSAQVGNAVARNAVRRAFDTWTAAGVGLTFTEVAQNQNPDIFIEWRPAADPDHSMVGGVLAHADFPPGCSIIVTNPPLPLHYDDQEHTWVDGAVANGFDIETVALHEIGHCLGMLHTNVNGSVMFPSVRPNFTLRALQPDDLAGIRNLYLSTIPTSGWQELQGDGLTTAGPGAAVFANRLYALVRGTDDRIYANSTSDGSNWVGWQELQGDGLTTAGPGAAVFANRLYALVRGTDDRIYATRLLT